MKQNSARQFGITLGLFAAFALWTAAICRIDVRAIGPEGTSVGFAAWNGAVHRLTGVHMTLYTVTDWLGLVPVGIGLGFAVLGLIQLIRRRSLLRVDFSILVLGVFYLLMLAAYLFFEGYVINYRPVLIEGRLEASYPSSTTILVLCVIPTAMLQLRGRLRSPRLRGAALWSLAVFGAAMVLGRLISGVHWCTDILGAVLLCAGLDMLYVSVCGLRSARPAQTSRRDCVSRTLRSGL